MQGDTDIIKCTRDTVRQSHVDRIHTQTKIIARSSAKSKVYAAALGASESKGTVSLLCDLGYVMKRVLAIDAKA